MDTLLGRVIMLTLTLSLSFPAMYEGDESNDGEDRPLGEGPHPPGHIPQEGEPDFVETNCHWEECSKEFDTQDELVKVRPLSVCML